MTVGKMGVGLSRRKLLKISAAAGAALATTKLATPAIAQSDAEELLVSSGGGDFLAALQKAYYDDFTKQTGIKIVPQPWKGLAELKVMVESSAFGQFDMMLTSSGEAASAQGQGLSEALDYGVIDRSSLIPGASGDNWFLCDVAANVLSWNTSVFHEGSQPKTWAEFFSPSNSSPRGLWKNANQTLELAALGAGIPLDKLYPLDIDAALKTLDKVRDRIVWWEGGSQSQQILAGGEVDMASMWVNRVKAIKDQGKPVDYSFNQGVCDGDTIVIPKNHPKKKTAMKLAAYLASPEPQARLVELIPLGPSNTKAIPLCDPKALSTTVADPKNLKAARLQDFDWWAKNSEKANNEFTKWLLG
ncbi:extracellular solute-binding protein [Mesorhizobium sp. B3-1-3]|uniref:extracellular solute-binding protein n=1 Tax=unclassified Mesorhizobium TaxID=325217 RepID=UPI001126AE9A|nr:MULTISPECIES: extracellular solute-binding protein [unclassified Mesorhizobium]TPI57353.1 extracellular solute-binding protein [Mesorhizobium sp. B3-1-8]TPI63506.1 extracellular solute-binding protein [Mesorhizobium sp. B3-1-3]